MVYVINEATKEVLFKIDAWAIKAETKAMIWARDNGYTYVMDYITAAGNMVILVQ